MEPKSRTHRLVRIYYHVRTGAFAALCVAIGMHMWGRGYGTIAWISLVLQFLIYPHLVYWWASAARNSLAAELSNLKLDCLLVGIWAAALGFPIWIAFALFLGTTLNNAINGGARSAMAAVLAFASGALAWGLVAGFHFSPDTSAPVTALCVLGLSAYVVGLGAITFVQNRKLQNTRNALQQSEEKFRILNEDLDQRVKERTEELEQANKEIGSFSYSISHDLRAPVRALIAFSEILLSEHRRELNPQGAHLLGRIAQNARRMGNMVDDLLRLSRVGRGGLNLQRVDLDSVVMEVVAAHSGEYRKTAVVAAPLPAANCDRGLILQAFDNLIGNAFKYSFYAAFPRVEIGAEQRATETVYFVRDNGTGFDMQYADKLFGIFQRLHSESEFPGTGVGLVIVKRIIERHGGRIWAEAKPNEGATFYFTLR